MDQLKKWIKNNKSIVVIMFLVFATAVTVDSLQNVQQFFSDAAPRGGNQGGQGGQGGNNTPDQIAKCLPTCATDDGRFMIIAGEGHETLVGQDINLQFIKNSNTPLKIFIFDGDINKYNPDTANWDSGYPLTTPFEYSVYADPEGTGGREGGNALITVSSNDMPNNDWHTITVPNDPSAQGANGNYYYQLHIRLTDPEVILTNSFKVATTSDASMYTIPEKPFSFMTAMNSQGDLGVIYNGTASIPNQTYQTTTYDGTFTFYINLLGDQEELYMADADSDRSDAQRNPTVMDTDDPNTPPKRDANGNPLPGEPDYPLFVYDLPSYDVRPEGVALGGTDGGTGAPNDDNIAQLLLRSPNITYTVSRLQGNKSWTNSNPSGNREWEVFLVSSTQQVPDADYHENNLIPKGIYRVQFGGMDINNLNAIYFTNSICPVDVNGNPSCGIEEAEFEGCTPGYWQNLNQHNWAWDPDNSGDTYLTTDLFNTIFGATYNWGYPYTLYNAITQTGGGSDAGQLSRHATAALLNINIGMNYPLTLDELVLMVQNAFSSGEYEALKNLLDGYNSAGCPLGNNPN